MIALENYANQHNSNAPLYIGNVMITQSWNTMTAYLIPKYISSFTLYYDNRHS